MAVDVSTAGRGQFLPVGEEKIVDFYGEIVYTVLVHG